MEFADLWLINTHNGVRESNVPPIDISDYPAVKKHLDQYYDKLEKRQDKGVTPYNLRNCAYLEEFDRQKIIYPNMTKFLPFLYDEKKYFTNQKCFIITGKNLEYLTIFFNSSLFKFCFLNNFPELQGGTRELSKVFFQEIPIMKITDQQNKIFKDKLLLLQSHISLNKSTKEIDYQTDKLIFNLYGLNQTEQEAIGYIEIK